VAIPPCARNTRRVIPKAALSLLVTNCQIALTSLPAKRRAGMRIDFRMPASESLQLLIYRPHFEGLSFSPVSGFKHNVPLARTFVKSKS
jgi:hypothetical protein